MSCGHTYAAATSNNLANIYNAQGRYEEAEQFYLKALQIDLQELGENHPDTALDSANLASLYLALKRFSEVEVCYLKACEIFTQRLGSNHPTTQTILRNFINFLDQVIAAEQISSLSNHYLTRYLLQQMI
jgi:tetratricopeptide (TPR) repeat protein